MGADSFAVASRAAAKLATEQVIEQRKLPATILRPNALFQNDLLLKDAIASGQVYATPLGGIGVTMVDLGDLAEVAALKLLRRERSADALPAETVEVVGPDLLTGEAMATLWSDVLGRPVAYAATTSTPSSRT